MKKYFLAVCLLVLIIPSVAFASWWNPFSWGVFYKTKVVPVIQVETQKTPQEKIAELQKQIDDLKVQQPSSSATPKTPVVEKKVTPKIPTPIPKEPAPVQTLDYSKYTDPITGKIYTPQEYAGVIANSKKDLTPYINLKVNDQDGPVTVSVNSLVNVSWTSENVVSCSGLTSNKPLNGRETIQINSNTTSPFTLKCLTSNGIIVSDSVVLNIIGSTLNNADPYGVSSGSGNAYSPEQMNAIDCAYYGTNCPTIDVRIINK